MPFRSDRGAKGIPPDEVTLRFGDNCAGVAPRDGGVLTRWTVSDLDILRPRPNAQSDPLQSACFPLAPYSNLIEGGGFHFGGRFYPLARNHPLEPGPIHGDAWLSAWEVSHVARDRITLSYQHDSSTGFPFRYRVLQEVELGNRWLSIRLRLTNLDHRTMPAGLGLHPYFRKVPGAQLNASHSGRWSSGQLVPDTRFCAYEELDDEMIDVCYARWSRQAQLYWPAEQLRISINASNSAVALVVYSPPSSDIVCVEPVTNVNDGFNAAASGSHDTGVQSLAPGNSLELHVTISVDTSKSS